MLATVEGAALNALPNSWRHSRKSRKIQVLWSMKKTMVAMKSRMVLNCMELEHSSYEVRRKMSRES